MTAVVPDAPSGGVPGADRAAFQRLHDEHAPALRRFAASLTRDSHLAEDIVQETLLRAWRHPALPDGREARPWLFAVVRNLAIDHHRSATSRREVTRPELPERHAADGTEAALDEWLVADALTALSADHRSVIVRSYYGRESVAEIARQLGVPVGTVKSRLHYAVRALRLALQERGVTAR